MSRTIQKKLNCKGERCADYFTLTITKEAYENVDKKKRVYAAECSKCKQKHKFTEYQKELLLKEGTPTINVVETKFDDLFDTQ